MKNNHTKKDIQIATCTLQVKMTSDEAFEIVHNPRGKVAKQLRKYFTELINGVAKKTLKKMEEDNISKSVNNC